MTFKLLWLPGPGHYRLRVFAGQSSQSRGYAGELTLKPDEAAALRTVLLTGFGSLGTDLFAEAGWIDPAVVGASRS